MECSHPSYSVNQSPNPAIQLPCQMTGEVTKWPSSYSLSINTVNIQPKKTIKKNFGIYILETWKRWFFLHGVYDFPQTVWQILLDKEEFLCSEEELCLVISQLCFM